MAGGSIHFTLPIADCQSIHCRLPIADCRFVGLKAFSIGNRQLAIGNLKSDGRALFYDMAVAHLYNSFAHSGGFRIVSDHDDGLIEPVI